MRSKYLFLVFLLCAACLAFVSNASANSTAIGPAKRVYAGVYLHDVTKFDQKDGVFDVDLELWAKWLGEFDPNKLKLANAAEIERELIGEEVDGAWHSARWRVKGTLRGEFPLHRFPFDAQTIAVVLELPEVDGELVPDLAGSGMREHFSITGWNYEPSFAPHLQSETYRSDLGQIASEGKPTTVRRVGFEVTLRRPLLLAGIKLFVPLLVILLVALVALFVHPRNLDVRSGVGVTALLACFAFQFAVADTMPNVSYITIADVLFLFAYALTAALLIISIISYIFHERGNEKGWKRLDRVCLVVFPLVLGAGIGLALWPPKKALATPPGAVPGERPASSKPLLRIGINKLQTTVGGLAGRAANWGTGRADTKGERTPILVEQLPSITNDSLVFLADGRLDVTWKLRPNLKWSDGKPLTAEDLEFALKVSPDPRIDEIKMADPSTLVVRFKERVAVALSDITPLPKHVLAAEFEKGGFEAVRDFRRKNIVPTAGAYKVIEFVEDQKLVLEANENFVGPAPSIPRIEITAYKEEADLIAAFESGAIDMISPNALSPEGAAALSKKKPDAVKIRPSEVLVYLYPDPAHPLLGKRAVRKALLTAFDRERIRQEVFGGGSSYVSVVDVPVPGPPPEGSAVYRFDAEAAKRELENAGAAGAKIPLVHGNTPIDRAIAAQLVKDASAVGITFETSEVPNTFDVYRKRKVGGLLLMNTTGDRESPPEKYWSVPQIDGKYDRSFRNEAYDDDIAALVSREERALYPERREQIRDQLFVAYSQRLPGIPLFFMVDRIVADPTLKGWEDGSGTYFGRTIEQWHFAKPE